MTSAPGRCRAIAWNARSNSDSARTATNDTFRPKALAAARPSFSEASNGEVHRLTPAVHLFLNHRSELKTNTGLLDPSCFYAAPPISASQISNEGSAAVSREVR